MLKSVQVGPFRFKIKWSKKALNKHRLKTDLDAVGLTLIDDQMILIDPHVGADMQRETLFHEVLHACWFVCGFRETKKLTEEQTIVALSPVLLDTLRRNPKLVEALLSKKQSPKSGDDVSSEL